MEPYAKAKMIIDYLNKYPEAFTEIEKNGIVNYITDEEYNFFIPDTVRELYDELGILPDNRNIYQAFMELLDSEFYIKDKRIIEIGCGIIPTLAKRIANMQTTGRITVYDPRLSIYEEETEHLKLVKARFGRRTAVGDANLIIGLMPCEAAEVIVHVATKHKIDFMLALCEGGIHGDEFDYFEDEEEWRSCLIQDTKNKVEEQQMGKLKIKYLKEYGDPYPIIYNERG